MLAATVLGVSPASNPDSVDYLVTFSGDYGEELVGRRVDLVFSFPQRDDPNWGMDLNVVEVIGG